MLEALRLLLKPDGYSIETAASPQQLLRALGFGEQAARQSATSTWLQDVSSM